MKNSEHEKSWDVFHGESSDIPRKNHTISVNRKTTICYGIFDLEP